VNRAYLPIVVLSPLWLACRDTVTPPQAVNSAYQVSASGHEAVDLGTLGGMNGSYARDINDRGQVVGWSHSPSDWGRAVLWENGVMSVLPTLSEGPAGPVAINNAGLIAGISEDENLYARFVTWENGVIRNLGVFSDYSRLDALDQRGDVLISLNYGERFAEAVVWYDGALQNLGHLARPPTYARAMNSRQQVVGASTALEDAYGEPVSHPFLWERGVMRDLGVLGRPDCPDPNDVECHVAQGEAVAINEAGAVVGWSTDTAGVRRPFLWQQGTMQDLGAFPGLAASATKVNTRGQVAGIYTFPPPAPGRLGDTRGFVWEAGVTRDLGTLFGNGTTMVVAMNDKGEVVGWSGDPMGARHAFVWRNGQLYDLGVGPQGGIVSVAAAINAKGDIAGWSSPNSWGWPRRALLWRRLSTTP
jgi:probable HAF family extracellular repeat protein